MKLCSRFTTSTYIISTFSFTLKSRFSYTGRSLPQGRLNFKRDLDSAIIAWLLDRLQDDSHFAPVRRKKVLEKIVLRYISIKFVWQVQHIIGQLHNLSNGSQFPGSIEKMSGCNKSLEWVAKKKSWREKGKTNSIGCGHSSRLANWNGCPWQRRNRLIVRTSWTVINVYLAVHIIRNKTDRFSFHRIYHLISNGIFLHYYWTCGLGYHCQQ